MTSNHFRITVKPQQPPKWGGREVRRLLRGLRRPHQLEHEPLAQVLCQLFGTEDAYQVVLQLIRQTFINKGLVGKRLYEMIQRCDVDASSTQETTAQAMGLSVRQFFRYRREAVSALVAQVNGLIAEKAPDTGPLSALARVLVSIDPATASEIYDMSSRFAAVPALERIDAALGAGQIIDDTLLQGCEGTERHIALLKLARTCFRLGQPEAGDKIQDAVRYAIIESANDQRDLAEFELLLTSYVRAAMFLDAEEAAEIARQLRAAAQMNDENLLTALFVEAESAIRLGDTSEALEALQLIERRVFARNEVRAISMLIHLRAALSFLQGDLQEAYTSVRVAQLALQSRPFDAITVCGLAGRVSMALGLSWRAPVALLSVPEAVSTMVTTSRHEGRVRVSGSRSHAYGRLLLQFVDLRSQLMEDARPELSQVQNTTVLAEEAGYSTLSSLGLATLGALHSRGGDLAAAQNCYIAAWARVVANHDFFNAHDLFVSPVLRGRAFGPIDLDDTFLRTFYEQTTKRFPSGVLTRGRSTRLRDEFWRTAIMNAYDIKPMSETLALTERLAEEISGTVGRTQDWQKYRASFMREVSRNLSLFVPATLRSRFIETLTLTLTSFYSLLASKMTQTQMARCTIDSIDKAS